MSNIETIVIVGAGQAGASAILELRGNKYGMVTMCVGTGQGAAAIYELL